MNTANSRLPLYCYEFTIYKSISVQAWTALSVSGGLGYQIQTQAAHESDKVISPTHRPPLSYGNIPGTHLCQEAESNTEPQCSWKDYVNEKSHNIIGNRNRDLPTCSAVPEQTASLRVSAQYIFILQFNVNYKMYCVKKQEKFQIHFECTAGNTRREKSENLGNITCGQTNGSSRLHFQYVHRRYRVAQSVQRLSYGLDGPGIESRLGRDFPPVQTGPGAHPASCTMGTGSLPGVNSGRGVGLTPHPHLVPKVLEKSTIRDRIPVGTRFFRSSRPALGPTQPPVQQVPGISRGQKRPWREADPPPHLVPRSQKKVVQYLYSP